MRTLRTVLVTIVSDHLTVQRQVEFGTGVLGVVGRWLLLRNGQPTSGHFLLLVVE